MVNLTESTIEANSRFFDSIDQVPKTAITMGIGSIIKAKNIILLASGKNKAKVIRQLLKAEKITTQLPASMLLLHPNVTIVDEEAYEDNRYSSFHNEVVYDQEIEVKVLNVDLDEMEKISGYWG